MKWYFLHNWNSRNILKRIIKNARWINLMLVLGLIGFDAGFFTYCWNNNYYMQDIDDMRLLPNGNIMVVHYDVWDTRYNIGLKGMDDGRIESAVTIINPVNNQITWEYQFDSMPHQAILLPDGHVLITEERSIDEINYPGHDIVWSWDASKVNWTLLNPAWGKTSYYMTPNKFADWAHINSIFAVNHSNWIGIFVSIRNFDLLVEINYTANVMNPAMDGNVVWWFGGESSLLNRAHDVSMMKNGNLLMSDSQNNRIIEINFSSREIVRQWTPGLRWSRGVREMPDSDLLISDIDRVFIMNPETNQIVWERDGLIMNFGACPLPNGNILVGTGHSDLALEIDPTTNQVIWQWGLDWFDIFFSFTFILLAIISGFNCIINYPRLSRGKKNVKGIFALWLVLIMVFVSSIFIWKIIENASIVAIVFSNLQY